MSTIFSTDELETFSSDRSAALQNDFEITATAYGLTTNNGSAPSTAPMLSKSDENITSTDTVLSGGSPQFVTGLSESIVTSTFQSETPSPDENTDELTGIAYGEEIVLNTEIARSTSKTVSGRLDFSDSLNPTRNNALKDDYLLKMPTAGTVQINLNSSAFDTYLQLVNVNTGRVLASNDDGGQGTNSKLSFTARANTQYLLRATSYRALATGSYSLTAHINTGNSPQPPSQPTPPSSRFSSAYGYGRVDAAAAVASAIGRSRFSNVADIGGNQWNNDMVYAPEVWAQGYTGRGVTVAVIDSGVDIFHEDLRDNIWVNRDEVLGDGIDNDGNGYVDDRYGWNFGRNQNNNNVLPGTNDPGQSHGTHVAGTIAAANNGIGITGVAHGANIMALRLGDVSGNRFTNGGDVASAIRYAVDNGADVINMSLGTGDPNGRVRAALAYAASRNVITVSSSGNQGLSSPGTPARYATDYGISVGSVGRSGRASNFSNRAGSSRRMQHVMAPGEEIVSTVPNNGYSASQGTSMAAPHVAGVVALMLDANPNLTHAQVREILTGTAISSSSTNGFSNSVTGGNTTFNGQRLQGERGTNSVDYSSIDYNSIDYNSIDYSNWQSELPIDWSAPDWDSWQVELSNALDTVDSIDLSGIAANASEAATEIVDSVEKSIDRLLAARSDAEYTDEYSYNWQLQLEQSLADDLLAPAIA